jgi:hypothetical protein
MRERARPRVQKEIAARGSARIRATANFFRLPPPLQLLIKLSKSGPPLRGPPAACVPRDGRRHTDGPGRPRGAEARTWHPPPHAARADSFYKGAYAYEAAAANAADGVIGGEG